MPIYYVTAFGGGDGTAVNNAWTMSQAVGQVNTIDTSALTEDIEVRICGTILLSSFPPSISKSGTSQCRIHWIGYDSKGLTPQWNFFWTQNNTTTGQGVFSTAVGFVPAYHAFSWLYFINTGNPSGTQHNSLFYFPSGCTNCLWFQCEYITVDSATHAAKCFDIGGQTGAISTGVAASCDTYGGIAGFDFGNLGSVDVAECSAGAWIYSGVNSMVHAYNGIGQAVRCIGWGNGGGVAFNRVQSAHACTAGNTANAYKCIDGHQPTITDCIAQDTTGAAISLAPTVSGDYSSEVVNRIVYHNVLSPLENSNPGEPIQLSAFDPGFDPLVDPNNTFDADFTTQGDSCWGVGDAIPGLAVPSYHDVGAWQHKCPPADDPTKVFTGTVLNRTIN